MRRFLALALAACSAPAPVPTHKPAPAPTVERDEDLARLPDDTWAVGALDLVQLRASMARRWLWEIAGEESALVYRCRDELAAGTRATIALSGDGADTMFAIVHGIDRAAITTCAKLDVPPPRDVAPNREPCDGFDAAVHALTQCHVMPETQVPALAAAAEQLRQRGAAACPAAQQAIDAAVSRREALGWSCRERHLHGRSAEHVDQKAVARGAAIEFGATERVDFLDDHTIAITKVSEYGQPDLAKAAAKLAPARHGRWFESMAGTVDRTRGGWAIADLKQLVKDKAAVSISGGIRGDLAIDIQIASAAPGLTNEIVAIATRASAEPDFAGAKLAFGCAPMTTSPRTPKLLACEAAEQHIATFTSTPAVDYSGLLAERAARCVVDNWPDDYVACVGKAGDEHAFAACSNQLSAADRERVEGGLESACHERAFSIHVTYPDARFEALKLSSAITEVERDCRQPQDAEVTAHFFADNDGHYVLGCTADRCTTYDLANGHPMHDKSAVSQGECVGPIHRDPGGWTDAQRRCDGGAWFKPGLPKDATVISADGKRALAVTKAGVQVWDAAGKSLGKLALGKGCTTATFLGDLVAVGCGAQSYLATPSGTKLATLGDVILTPLPLPDRTWALVSRAGDRIDLYTGAGKKQTELAVPHHADVADAATDGAGTIAIAYGGTGPDAGAVAVITAKQELRFWQLPVCPQGH